MSRSPFAFAVVLLSAACPGQKPAPAQSPKARVRCAPLETRSWAQTRDLRGVVSAQPDRDAVVSAQAPGRLLKVSVREGDSVGAGDVVAEVEAGPLRDALKQSAARLAQTRAQREAAASVAAREEHLFERGINARQSLEAARAALAQADGAVALASAQLDLSRLNVERATVRSPIAGKVLRLLRREGELVDGTPATPILEIADTAALELAATVSAADLVELREGQRAAVEFDAVPGRTFAATVHRVAPALDPATGLGAARLTLETWGASLPLGMMGAAHVEVTQPRPVTVAPAAAVKTAGGASAEVLLCEAGVARRLEVVTGARRDGFVELVGDAGVGGSAARVVVEGLTGLQDGAPLEELR